MVDHQKERFIAGVLEIEKRHRDVIRKLKEFSEKEHLIDYCSWGGAGVAFYPDTLPEHITNEVLALYKQIHL